ncbi:MAG: Adenylosuccinate lyase [Candidatus Nomurabacteria bacterium GW2011_GWF2_43_8]|uniref:Adenylosuccinate lyase n=3 Tax=Candidatus Nomuraibacteriota TaxID=1752729 RepID=A0A0G1FKX4_9BACT|nr:MAG: Adenylosuccinate lyase [Candidatus Nomurabacteria bacterium GW2011_GWA2_43_15]KKT20100.1 MAG: Adenylosuccinate lyase [Candidatus Nomurabacteria bacterium GW2011_GWB1_43_7]KKT22603.1 MAG: Adenylosuccinate lyase [Candidatus Nomurabacteria bacterium GW2011_GWF2_43_8]
MSLNSISPIDGRYEKASSALAPIFSERGLMRYRVIVEGEYLIALSELKTKLRKLSDKEKKIIRDLYDLSKKDAQVICDIETKGYKSIKATDHDVKAVEYFMKERLSGTTLKDVLEWIHFGLTSEDTNNLAYGLMLRDGTEILIKKLKEIIKEIAKLAQTHKSLPMLARTHGQPATPTTFGKEMKVFAQRLERGINHLFGQKILVKLNGATGNYNAHVVAFPNINWLNFTKTFIARLNNLEPKILRLEPNLYTTQIEPHDSYVELFDRFKRLNNMLIDFNQDMWRYISDDWIVQKPAEGTVGSSTMPHKINPIKFENSEGNLGIANSMFEFFGRKLPISRLQRDLSDSTVQRNFGVAFAHSLIAYEYLLKGLSKINVNKNKILEALNSHPEVIAEAIQTILRREGAEFPYEKLKELTRGKKVTMQDFSNFIDNLKVSDKVKKELKKITPENYIGLASKLATLK